MTKKEMEFTLCLFFCAAGPMRYDGGSSRSLTPHPSATLTPVSPSGSVVAKRLPPASSDPEGEGKKGGIADTLAMAAAQGAAKRHSKHAIGMFCLWDVGGLTK